MDIFTGIQCFKCRINRAVECELDEGLRGNLGNCGGLVVPIGKVGTLPLTVISESSLKLAVLGLH